MFRVLSFYQVIGGAYRGFLCGFVRAFYHTILQDSGVVLEVWDLVSFVFFKDSRGESSWRPDARFGV